MTLSSPQRTTAFQNLRPIMRQEAYQADITYGTNNEFGFDYLRDNMVLDKEPPVATRAALRNRG